MASTIPLTIIVAINPRAAFGLGLEAAPPVVAALEEAGHIVTALSMPSYEELRDAVASELRSGADALVVVGGDGMVSLGVNLVADSSVRLGIIPSGTGNDIARALGLPLDNTEAAIRMLLAELEHEPRRIDAGRVTAADGTVRWFGGVLSAGFDAIVNERANHMAWPRGPRRYTLAMVWELLWFRPIRYRVTIDGDTIDTRGMLVSVANGTSIGGGMLITPDAQFDDGLLDVFIVGSLPKLRFIRLFPLVFRGRHVGNPAVTIRRGATVRLESDDVVAYADGERVGMLPVDVEVVPGALLVLAPIL